jgi:hypothetical protein
MKVRSLARAYLQEMALDLGGHPDFIDPEKRRKLERGTHPYAQNPAYPQRKPTRRNAPPTPPGHRDEPGQPPRQQVNDPTRSYAEYSASEGYQTLMQRVAQYTGKTPQELRAMGPRGLMEWSRLRSRSR